MSKDHEPIDVLFGRVDWPTAFMYVALGICLTCCCIWSK